jgi:hypothetical protein
LLKGRTPTVAPMMLRLTEALPASIRATTRPIVSSTRVCGAEAVPCGVDRVDERVEPLAPPADHVQDRVEHLALRMTAPIKPPSSVRGFSGMPPAQAPAERQGDQRARKRRRTISVVGRLAKVMFAADR